MGEEESLALEEKLRKAMGKMLETGYKINSPVKIKVDRKLNIMGYSKKEKDCHLIVVSEWSLESGMVEGLILHELAHIYFMERGAVTHRSEILERILERFSRLEGLRTREREYLIEAYNHLQNIIVDDIVFRVIDERMVDAVRSFFQQWVTDKTTGDPVSDAAILCRNAFAIASLKRRNLIDDNDFVLKVNKRFIEKLGGNAKREFEWIERFLENAKSSENEEEFAGMLESYFERIIGLMRTAPWIEDLK